MQQARSTRHDGGGGDASMLARTPSSSRENASSSSIRAEISARLSSMRLRTRFWAVAGLGCPTLVVHGELDPIPAEWSRVLAGTIPRAELVVLEGSGHFPRVEDAEPLRAAVMPWILRDADGPAAARETTKVST